MLIDDGDPSAKLPAHSGRGNAGPARPALGGGRYGIRTHGDPEATTAFEAAPFVRSGNLPATRLAVAREGTHPPPGCPHPLGGAEFEGAGVEDEHCGVELGGGHVVSHDSETCEAADPVGMAAVR